MPGSSSPAPVLLGTAPDVLLAQALSTDGPEGFCEAVRWVEGLRETMSPERAAAMVWQVVPASHLRSAQADDREEA